MKALKVYKTLVVGLVLLNCITLFFLVMRPQHPPKPPDSKDMAKELGLTGTDAKEVKKIQKLHHQEMRTLMDKNRMLHQQLHVHFVTNSNDSIKTTQLIERIVQNHEKVEWLVFNYFNEVASHCNGKQRLELNKRYEQLVNQMAHPPRHKRK
jgi:CRISPR/Cas system CSM-associated protein Csm4 (group 5 of RAMP superfamily)